MTQEWRDDRKYVLDALDRYDRHNANMADSMTSIQVQIAMLRVKSGVWGAIGASIPLLVALAFIWIKG